MASYLREIVCSWRSTERPAHVKFVTAVLFCFVAVAGAAQQPDREGFKDPSLFTRPPHYWGDWVDEKEVDAFDFPVSADDLEHVEGHYGKYQYRFDNSGGETSNPGKTLRYYQNAATRMGGKVVYESGDLRKTTLRIPKGGREVWALLYMGAYDYSLVIVECPAMKKDEARLEAKDVTPGQVRENPKDGLKYVWIPPGTFTMGCSPEKDDCSAWEKPAHQVTLTKGFWFGQTPVTVGAYKRYAGATGRRMPSDPDFDKENKGWTNEKIPIANVTWEEAQDYCYWAGGRLPTDAEWEYAARGGSTEGRYGPIDEIAWYRDNSKSRTHEVALKRANGFGLFDVLGNVLEWVSDSFDRYYYKTSPAQDPPGPSSGEHKVLRGGCWGSASPYVRVSYRFEDMTGVRHTTQGIRCAVDVDNP